MEQEGTNGRYWVWVEGVGYADKHWATDDLREARQCIEVVEDTEQFAFIVDTQATSAKRINDGGKAWMTYREFSIYRLQIGFAA